jgi:hypothetical protein
MIHEILYNFAVLLAPLIAPSRVSWVGCPFRVLYENNIRLKKDIPAVRFVCVNVQLPFKVP